MPTPQQDCQALLAAVVPLIERALAQYGMIYPFGCGMQPDREVVLIGGHEENEYPSAQEIIELLVRGFQEDAASGEYMATATVFLSKIRREGETDMLPAVTVELEHAGGFSEVIHYLYSVGGGTARLGLPSRSPGTNRIFHHV